MSEDALEIVVQGITEAGETFRPSDRLSLLGADGYSACSPFLQPIIAGGVCRAAVDR